MAKTKKEILPEPVLFRGPRKLAIIKWRDAYYDDDVHTEQSISQEDTECIIFSAGFFISDKGKYVRLAIDFIDDCSYRHVQRIAKENIIDIQILG